MMSPAPDADRGPSRTNRPFASLSLDLDNKWSYLKTHGDSGWETLPSYLDVVVPRVLEYLSRRGQRITFFIVGQDAAVRGNREPLRAITAAGHEVGNHSFHHEPWLHRYSPDQLEREFDLAEGAIEQATGVRPVGFRGPGYSFSPDVLRLLERRGYEYDCSTFPSFLGPAARAYYFLTAKLSREQKQERQHLFGDWWEGFRPLRPYVWRDVAPSLWEIPVTTMPLFKAPFHLSYLLFLAERSSGLARTYFQTALRLCRLCRVEPSFLLHPLDFLGREDDADLGFFPGMAMPRDQKLAAAFSLLDLLLDQFSVGTMKEHADRARNRR